MTKPLGPMFKHYGSKWKLSAKLEPPRFDMIIEPFAGAAGYSHRYGANRRVVLRDSGADVVEIWNFLLGADQAAVLGLPVDFGDVDIRTLGLARGPLLLIQRWLTPQGSTTNWKFPPSILDAVRAGTAAKAFWGPSIRQRIADQLPAISKWTIEHGSFEEMDTSAAATWSVDPPYQGNRSSGSYGSAPLDYRALGQWCKSLVGQVYVHEQLGADWLPFKTLDAHTQTGRVLANGKHKRQHEVFWSNQDPKSQ